jgi:hypothetical protein
VCTGVSYNDGGSRRERLTALRFAPAPAWNGESDRTWDERIGLTAFSIAEQLKLLERTSSPAAPDVGAGMAASSADDPGGDGHLSSGSPKT